LGQQVPNDRLQRGFIAHANHGSQSFLLRIGHFVIALHATDNSGNGAGIGQGGMIRTGLSATNARFHIHDLQHNDIHGDWWIKRGTTAAVQAHGEFGKELSLGLRKIAPINDGAVAALLLLMVLMMMMVAHAVVLQQDTLRVLQAFLTTPEFVLIDAHKLPRLHSTQTLGQSRLARSGISHQ
jgi:hypothetical protein